MTPEQLERLRQLPGYDENSEEMVSVYQDVPFFLSKDFVTEGNKIEYMNVLKNMALSSGYSKELIDSWPQRHGDLAIKQRKTSARAR